MGEKAKFGSKIGLIAATVGSAVGLGNIWRFPAETQQNGGAAFLIVYILCVFLLGIPVMLAEFSLGRGGHSNVVDVFKKLKPGTAWWVTGALALLASYLILCFYMVVAGWTFEYFWQSLTGNLYEGAKTLNESGMDSFFHNKMESYICTDMSPLVNTYIMIGINLVVLLLGVRKGIERISNLLMQLLFVLLLIFSAVSLTLPNAADGLEFFLTPDFSKITPAVVVNALGQAFFSLSLGMGILITYAAYYPKNVKLVSTSFTVASLDLLVAVLMGIIIFPAVTSFGLDSAQLRGTTLVFVTLPEVFSHMPATSLWSVLFFLLLMVAALTSTISIAEVTISFIEDKFKKSRFVSCLIVLVPLFFLSALCSLSFGTLDHIKLFGMNIFDFLDNFATNILLPIVSLLVCIFMGRSAQRKLFKDEITNNGTVSNRFYPFVLFIIRWIAPVLILIIWLTAFIDF